VPLSVPLSLLDFPGYFTDLDGEPLASGYLLFYIAGTTTNGVVYADNQGSATLTNPVQLDSSGFAQVFLSSAYLYDVVVKDSTSVALYTVSGVGNPAQIAFAGLGNILAEGAKNVTSGYSILSTDNLVTVNSTGGPSPALVNLPSATTRSTAGTGSGFQITIKNMGNVPLSIVPAGSDAIEGIAAAYAVAASASPLFRTVTLVSDGASAFWIIGGIGI
jgi:hypothetical protein